MKASRHKPFLWIILFTTAFDLVTKKIAEHTMKKGRKEIGKGKITLTLVKNEGAAYNVFSGNPHFVKYASGFFIVMALAQFFKLPGQKRDMLEKTGLSFLIGGGLGNWIDRAANGAVTDFISLKWKKTPVFNFADLFILWGVILYAAANLFNNTNNKTGNNKHRL